jgi:hypothetical protein
LPPNSYIKGSEGFAKITSQTDSVITTDKTLSRTSISIKDYTLLNGEKKIAGSNALSIGNSNISSGTYSIALGCNNIASS